MELSLLGSRIKAERKRHGITQELLAEWTGISQSFLWEIEAGRKAPAIQTFYNIASTLRVSTDYLMGLSNENKLAGSFPDTEYDREKERVLEKLNGFEGKDLRFIYHFIEEFSKYTDG